MKIRSIILAGIIALACTANLFSQEQEGLECSIGSSLFMLWNFDMNDTPYFGQLNFSYHVTEKDLFIMEAITWVYHEPLGTYGDSDEDYPGKVRSFGLGAGYQRFWWKGLYSTLLVTPFYQQYLEEDNDVIQTGFQLYLQTRLGYRMEFFNKRFFIEPSLAFNYFPVNTNMPESFRDVKKGTPDYFLFEPGLHYGIRF